MTSEHRSTRLGFLLVAAFAAGACGNYSNEDLEFMNAVPDQSDLSANIPQRSSALSVTGEAELAKDTHDVAAGFNGMLDNVLSGVETIRTYQPTSRGPDSRTWGPIPADQAGWQWRFVMTREANLSFDYDLDLEPVGAGDAGWIPFVTGNFAPSPGVRRGVGSFTFDTTGLRDAGFPLDDKTAPIVSVSVSYSTAAYPISVVMDLTNYPNYPTDLTTTNTVHYEYGAQSNGEGALEFTVTGNLILTTAAIEVVQVTSRWLASGAGRADLTVLQGDGMGAMQTECWDASFTATFNDKPWSTAEDTGDVSACPQFPTL